MKSKKSKDTSTPNVPAKIEYKSPLESMEISELATLSDTEFQGHVRKHARTKVQRAMKTYEEVMDDVDEKGEARVLAADRIMKYSEAQKEESVIPQGLSEEVYKAALLGLAGLRDIALAGGTTQVLRDVTPAKTDPRVIDSLESLSPSRAEGSEKSHNVESENLPHENYEIIERHLEPSDESEEEENQAQDD